MAGSSGFNVGTIEGIIRLKDEFTTQLTKAASQLQHQGAKIKRLGEQYSNLGTKLSIGLTVPIAAVAISAQKMADTFEESLTKIETLVGVNREQVAAWKGDILALSVETGRSAKDLADAMFFITSAGLRGSVAMDTLRASAKGAVLGLGEAVTIADAATSAMNAYGAANLSAEKAVNVIALAVRAGKLEAAALAPVLGNLLPTASAMKVRFEDVAGALAVMSRTGSDAAASAVSVQAFMSSLLKPTKQANETLAQVGLSMAQLREVIAKPGGLVEAMRLLNERTSQLSDEALASVIPNIRAFRGVMNVMAQDTAVVDDILGQVASGVDVLNSGMKRVSTDGLFIFSQVIQSFKKGMIELGDALGASGDVVDGWAKKVAGAFSNAATAFGNMPQAAKHVVSAMLGIAAISGPVLVVTGQLAIAYGALLQQAPRVAAAFAMIGNSMKLLLGPWGLALAAAIALGSTLRKGVQEAQREIDALVAGANKAGAAINAFRHAQAQISSVGRAVVTPEMRKEMEDQLAALKAKAEATARDIATIRSQIETGQMPRQALPIADKTLERLRAEAQRAGIEIAKLEEVLSKTVAAAGDLGNATGGEDGAAGGLGTLSEAAQQLKDDLAAQQRVMAFFQQQLNATGRNFEEAKRRADAFAQVLAAKLEPTEGVGKTFYEQALAISQAADAYQEAATQADKFKNNLIELDRWGRRVGESAERLSGVGAIIAQEIQRGVIDLGKLREQVEWEEKRFAATQQSAAALREWAVAKAVADYAASTKATPKMIAEFEALTRRLVDMRDRMDKLGESWSEINKGFSRAIGESLFQAADDFLTRMEEGLVHALPSGMQSFAKALLDAANAWLIAMLKNIAVAKLAAAGIGEGAGSGDGSLKWLKTAYDWGAKKGWWGSAGGAGSAATTGATGGVTAGGGTITGTVAPGMSASTIAAYAGTFAVLAGVAYGIFRNRDKHEEQRKGSRYSSTVQLGLDASGNMTSGVAGMANAAAAQAGKAISELFNALKATTRASVGSLAAVTVDVSENGKNFITRFNGEITGRFASMEKAILAAAKVAFTQSAEGLDEVVRLSVAGFSGESVEGLQQAVELMQGVADEFNGVMGEMERQVANVIPAANALTNELINLGVNAIDAAITGARAAVNGFRAAWDAISGKQRTPAEEREAREAARRLLLAETKLKAEQLRADIKILEVRGRLAQGQFELDSAVLQGGSLFLRTRGKQWGSELSMSKAYILGRQAFVKGEVNLFQAELDAMQAVLVELDKLIGEISVGNINIGDFGKHVRDFGNSTREWMDRLREFRRDLDTGPTNPGGLAARVAAAKADFERFRELFKKNPGKYTDQFVDAARAYLTLYEQVYGNLGSGFADLHAEIKRLVDGALGVNGPTSAQKEGYRLQATYTADALSAKLRRDGSGRLTVADEEARQQRDATNNHLLNSEAALESIHTALVVLGDELRRDRYLRPNP